MLSKTLPLNKIKTNIEPNSKSKQLWNARNVNKPVSTRADVIKDANFHATNLFTRCAKCAKIV